MEDVRKAWEVLTVSLSYYLDVLLPYLTDALRKYEPEPDSDEDSDLEESDAEREGQEENEYEESSSSGKRRSLGEGDRIPPKRRKVEVSP